MAQRLVIQLDGPDGPTESYVELTAAEAAQCEADAAYAKAADELPPAPTLEERIAGAAAAAVAAVLPVVAPNASRDQLALAETAAEAAALDALTTT